MSDDAAKLTSPAGQAIMDEITQTVIDFLNHPGTRLSFKLYYAAALIEGKDDSQALDAAFDGMAEAVGETREQLR